MSDCSSIDPLLTPYVDGELPPADAQKVDAHVHACPPCRARMVAERSMRDLLHARQAALRGTPAPDALHAKCAALASTAGLEVRTTPAARRAGVSGPPRTIFAGWRSRIAPVALAATLTLIVGGAFLYRMTQVSTRVMAAELTADHMKCFLVNAVLGTAHSPGAVESALASGFGWQAHLPERPEDAGLELVGARPCVYGEGKVAHIMYRHNGRPVSVFMLPRTQRPEELLGVLGHEAAIWSQGDRTFVVIARKSRAELERIASYIHAGLR
jgi:anti-sigma factor RsiW